jgi:hypothetical protein
MSITQILGSEHDLAVTNALLKVLRDMGAEEVSRNWGVAGSQEVNTLEFTLKGRPLTVEAETYVGLSVTGDAPTVEIIAARVGEIVRG